MDRRSLLAGTFIVLLAAVWMGGIRGEQGGYEIIEMSEGEIEYPQVKFLDGKDGEKEKEVNDLILDHVYGPCGFLSDPGTVAGILAGEFETERGAIRPDNKYMDACSVMEDQPIAGLDGSDEQYFYFLREDAVGVIIIGLPRYGGSYSIIRVSRP